MSFEPQKTSAIERYREQTAGHKKLAGVTAPSFLCKKCKQKRQPGGRRQAVTGDKRSGWLCRECK